MIRWPWLATLCLVATSAWPCQICFRGMALTPAQTSIHDTTVPPNMMPPVPFTCMGITICVV